MIAAMKDEPIYTTGLRNLDRTFGGARCGELTVVLSAYGQSPSRLLVPIAQYAGAPTLVFTSAEAEVTRDLRRHPDLYIDASGHGDFGTIARRTRDARNVLGIRGIVIEDLHLIRGARYKDVRSRLRRMFSEFPAKLGVAVIVGWMSEYERDRPRWSDLYGTIAEDPDLLILMSSDSYADNSRRVYAHRQDRPGVADDEFWVPGSA